MCGIAGGVDFNHHIERQSLARALACLELRGPDAEGIYENQPALLGHRRLSIIDLDPRANQPMRLGSLVISFNGEIYNYLAVKHDLEQLGLSFQTQSDTEVILAAFRHEGIACLKRFEGMFAFAIWDEEAKRLTLARDRFGEKPLVYYHEGTRFCFASEVAALEQLIGREKLTVDPEAMALYFQFSYIPAPFSPYQNMHQLEPGSWMEFDAASGALKQERYYTLTPNPRPIKEEAAIRELRRMLTDSVALRLSASDVPVATFLSGGVDSSIITALAANLRQEGVRAYSIGFPEDPAFDEAPFARMVAAQYPHVKHTVIDTNERALLDFTDKTLSKLGEPYADASIIPTAYLCAHVDEKVILGGDGADELFAGYGVYAAMRASAKIPPWLKSIALALPSPGNPHAVKNAKLRAGALFRSHLKTEAVEEYLSWRSYVSPSQMQALGIAQNHKAKDVLGPAAFETLADILALDIRFNMPNDMLKKVDLASMQHSVEVRLPYLDKALAEWALSLPESLLIKSRQRKYILKAAFSDLLPPAIFTRRKQGFLLPIRQWFKAGLLREQLLDMANNNSVLDAIAIRRLLEEHRSEKHDHSVLLWACYAFLKWQSR